MREDRDEDPFLEPIAQPLGVVPAPLEDAVEPAALPRSVFLEGSRAEEQPPVPERLVRVGIARDVQRLDQIDLVEVRRTSMSLAAVEPPEPPVGDDRPVSVSLFNGGDDPRTGVLVGMVRVLKVRPIEPATPWIDEGGAQVASPGRIFEEEVWLRIITPAGAD